MSTINIVKYFFHVENVPKAARMKKLVMLAYQTARAKDLHPKEIFIRSDIHDWNLIKGKVKKDPLGNHATISYKTEDQRGKETHITCHGYVTKDYVKEDDESIEFKKATFTDEKPDSTKKSSGKPVWPGPDDLWEAPDIGYSHWDE